MEQMQKINILSSMARIAQRLMCGRLHSIPNDNDSDDGITSTSVHLKNERERQRRRSNFIQLGIMLCHLFDSLYSSDRPQNGGERQSDADGESFGSATKSIERSEADIN